MQKENTNRIKVMVVDDSAFMRKMIVDMVQEEPGLEIVAIAKNGQQALKMIPEHRPHVVTLDIEMPVLNGIETLEQIKELSDRPNVIMLSSYTQTGSQETLRALELGAVDFVGKPSGSISLDIKKVQSELIAKIKAAYQATTKVTFDQKKGNPFNSNREISQNIKQKLTNTQKNKLIVIGASTGGPRALHEVIPKIPQNFPGSILVVQHMPKGFTKLLSERLNTMSSMTVKEAENNDPIVPGKVYIAPGDYHLMVSKSSGIQGEDKWRVKVDQGPPVKGLRPCADILFESASMIEDMDLVGVVLTGMGSDGAKGIKRLKRAGAHIIAEDESTCVVFGMPKAAINTGLVDKILPLPAIAPEILNVIT
ncbi:protein-glutamate methylesterase/protein-glutamine glutaminase [Natranaerobius thermophilus]|uniref:Protein-glutamate methylesterase/protein-glutamine glutaminase n=1 Tax=Natranaerobius thermophilus (strain ATCC BAA-1301 / DSM 18059 / JW/NM-WN-LF) TaxID=457570 RepID=B2A370_NATTJ|nr:chemotaxis response regulator protein-glutamate methylesterase [Natranaerobius thermophilus]ACB85000.1 response regulator receiver modulated CheB methylesterase [Natranaerobius thermophilus JW/NM-WN-LF]